MGKSLKKFWQTLESKNLAMPVIVVAFVVIATLAVVIQKNIFSPSTGEKNFGPGGQTVQLKASYCPPDSTSSNCSTSGGLKNTADPSISSEAPYYPSAGDYVAKLQQIVTGPNINNVTAARLEGQLIFYVPSP